VTDYLNAAALAAPAPGTYGNVGYNSIVGPRYWEWNEAISRQFQIREQQRIEIRAEAFNVTNSFPAICIEVCLLKFESCENLCL